MGCHGLGARCSGGVSDRMADSLSRCKSRQRAMRMRDEIPVREVLDQANLRIPEPHQQGTQPAHQLSLRTKGGTSEKPFP